ncbi:hypothetical protein GN958_ATG19361 [Phytophthora infestans]|nr:hypothetical protein GN958_ATG19361 [Phytophthora infestans]
MVQSTRCKAPVHLTSREDKMRRRVEVNEKIRALRKAGVYADSNRVRNKRTRENCFPSRSTGKTTRQEKGVPITHNPGMWREVLNIQRRRREESESENIRLKLILQRQRKVAASMTSMLQKRASGLASDCAGFIRRHGVPNPTPGRAYCGDVEGFNELLRRLDAACKEVDAVFAVNGLADMGETSDDVHIREGGDGTYAEAFSNKVLPFALRSATEATWDHFKGSEKHCGNGNIYEKTARDLDEPYTIVEAFTKE